MKYILLAVIFIGIVATCIAQSSQEYLEKGKQEMNLKHIDKAIDYFTKAIRLDPKNELPYLNRALCRMTQGAWAMAIPDCNKAISINSKQAVAYFVRGCSKANLKMDGCTDLRRSLDLGFAMAQKGLDQFCK